MLKLGDLIKLAGVELGDFKIHCSDNRRTDFPCCEGHWEEVLEAREFGYNDN